MKGLKLLKIYKNTRSQLENCILTFETETRENNHRNVLKELDYSRTDNTPFDPLEPLLLVLATHEQTPAPGGVNVQPDPVLVANI